jgi:hypothetical protein
MIWQSLGKACTWQEAGCMSTVRSFCSRGGNVVEWGRGSVQAGGCGRVDGVARRGENRAGGSRVVRDRCLDFLRASARWCSSAARSACCSAWAAAT